MSTSYNPKRISIIGAGKIGEAIIEAMVATKFYKEPQITATARSQKRMSYLEQTFGIKTASNAEAAAGSDVIVLAVKPQLAQKVINEITPALSESTLLISVMAGITLAQIDKWTGSKCPVVRAMPNTPPAHQKRNDGAVRLFIVRSASCGLCRSHVQYHGPYACNG